MGDMEPVVVWINGAFGVGKTSVAKALVREWDGAVLFDPERIGALLRRTIPHEQHTGDYQDFPLWRRLTIETVYGLASDYGRPVVVPMTLTNDAYLREIIGGLRESGVEVLHFALTARPATIKRRLLLRLMRAQPIQWAWVRVERCCEALDRPEFREHIATDNLSVSDIAARISSRLEAAGVTVEYLEQPGGIHTHPIILGAPEAQAAVEGQRRFLQRHLPEPQEAAR